MHATNSWKYKVLEIKPKMMSKGREKHIEDALNTLGAKGWELVSVQQQSAALQTMAFFRKPHN